MRNQNNDTGWVPYAVYHDALPTFGLGELRVANYACVGISTASPDLSDEAICELAFDETNNHYDSDTWYDLAQTWYDYSFVQKPCRSTSVGDVVTIGSGAAARSYRCDDVGWTRLPAPVTGKPHNGDGQAPA